MSDYLAKRNISNYLPPEIITLIITRLPLESVVKCTAVCKSWYALIKHRSFISNHLQAASLRDDLLLVRFTRGNREFYHVRRDNDAFEECKQFHLPFECGRIRVFRIVGTCNGLICLADDWVSSCNIILWNPSIHKHFILPKFDLSFKVHDHSTLGFGYDSASDDYKVLLIVPESNAENLTEVLLFSLNRNSWTRLSEVCPEHSCCGVREAAFVRGVLHWPGYLQYKLFSHMILAFELSTEKFHVMNYPGTLVHFVPQMSLIKYEESIAVVTSGSFDDMDDEQHELWVMKEYGVDSSWTKVLHSIDENGESVFDAGSVDDVLGVRKNGEVLLKVSRERQRGYELATVDLNCRQQEHKQQLKRLIGVGSNLDDLFVGSFVESLVLLDKGENDTEGKIGMKVK